MSAAEKVGLSLHPVHYQDLQRSGLKDATIEMMGAKSMRPADISKLAPGGLGGVESVLVFPYFGVNGFCRYKLFPPLKASDGRSVKYIQPKGTGCHLYILPPASEKLADISTALYFVEGEKKAAAAVQAGLCAIGIGGVWTWKTINTWKGIDELQVIAFADREVGLVFDSDTWARDDLQRAVYALAGC